MASAAQLSSDFRKNNASPPSVPSSYANCHWKPPLQGRLKLNTDAGCTNPNHWRIGAAFRKHDGTIALAKSADIPGYFKPEVAKALAVSWALEIAINHGFKALEVETDCLRLVQAFHDNGGLSPLQAIATDIHFLSGSFAYFSFNFVRRSSNQVAHFVSKHGIPCLAHNDFLNYLNSMQ